MKHVILVGDGMADYPLDELDGKTPLQVADKPNMDQLAGMGACGLLRTVPEGMEAGSDVANLSIMGYDPRRYYTGRGPLEAASIGVELGDDDVAFRCNLINADERIVDFNAGHIETAEAARLIDALNHELETRGRFYAGVSYRNLFVIEGRGYTSVRVEPPHDIVGESVEAHLPSGSEEADHIRELMLESAGVLRSHEVNLKRESMGKRPATMIWLWGQGLRPSMEPFSERYGIRGATITAVDLIKGLGVYAGLENINVPGATGYLDTDYRAKGRYAAGALEEYDFLYVHVEAPDEAGHAGDAEEKIRAIENIDRFVLGRLLDALSDHEHRIAVLPDHPTPIEIRTHVPDPVPCILAGDSVDADQVKSYDEFTVREGSLGTWEAHRLIEIMMDPAARLRQ